MIVYLLSLSAVVGLWYAATRFAKSSEPVRPPQPDPGIWLDSRDQAHFAGKHVAVDVATNEIICWSSRLELVHRDLVQYHWDRHCRIISVPEKPGDEIRVMLNVGPCTTEGSIHE